jgi:GT2 family glycosyltransferase
MNMEFLDRDPQIISSLPYQTLPEALLAAPQDKPFVTTWRSDDDIQSITFGEFIQLALTQAAYLQRKGLQSGNTLILVMPQGIPLMASFVGAMFLGAIPAILAYPNFKVEAAKYRLGLAGVSANLKPRLILVDHEFPNAQWIRLPKNFGLTKAWNLGWRAADAEYVFFLHDDTEVEPGTVLRLAEALDSNPEAAAVCPRLVDPEGRPAPQLGSLPPSGVWVPVQTLSQPLPVEYPRGAALMVRVFLLKAIRQIDERYGQFGGDADLAAQIRRAAKKILLIPSERVRHKGREGSSGLLQADFQNSRAVFLGKHKGFAAGIQVRIGAVFDALFGFRLGELKYLLAGQKIDGTQE